MKEGESLGLLGRASKIKASRAREPARGSKAAPAQAGGPSPVAGRGVDASGIDDADRAEIAQRLDEVARANRLPTDPALLALKAGKKGFVLPLIINIAAVLVIGASVYLFSYLFAQKEASEAVNETVLNSSEGRLLAELKRDSTARLEAKNKEIAEIQARMQSLDKEVSSLSSSFETRVKSKETELRTKLDAELDAERKRLQAEGLSEPVIQERLKKFEQEKSQEFQRQLAEFKTVAEAEKVAAEANYAKLRKEFEANAAGLAAERKRLEEESAKKEEELRASLAAELARKNAAATAQAQAGTEALEAAKAELTRLAEEKRKAGLAEEALVGLYSGIRQDLSQASYASALTKADGLRAYLMEPGVAALPGLAARREADLFAADSLASLAKLQLDRTKADAGLLLKQAEAYEGSRRAAEEGHKAFAAGDTAKADQAYQAALAQLPPILEAHQYFVAKAEATEALRRKSLTEALAKGAGAYDQGEFDQARASYIDALDYLPLDPVARKAFIEKIETTATKLATQKRQVSETRLARDATAAAKASLDAGRWEEAYAGFVAILSRLPYSQQADEATEGASRAMKGLALAQAQTADAAAQTQAELRYKIDGLLKDLETQKQAHAEALRLARVEDAKILEDLRTEKDGYIADLRAQLARVEANTLATQEVLPEAKAQAEEALARAKEAEERAGTAEARALAAEAHLAEVETALKLVDEKAVAALEDRDSLKDTLAVRDKDLETSRTDFATIKQLYEQTKAELETEKQKPQTQPTVEAQPAATGPDPLVIGLQAALDTAKKEKAVLQEVADRHEALKKAYGDYIAEEDRILAAGAADSATNALANLLSFVSSPSMREVFPGFSSRIQTNWQALQANIAGNFLKDASDICVAILRIRDPEERSRELAALRGDYARDAQILAFLTSLESQLGSGLKNPNPSEPAPASGLPEPAIPQPSDMAPSTGNGTQPASSGG